MSWLPVTGALPLTSMVPRPAPAGRRPAMKFKSVVLPQPLGPTIETNSPGRTRSDTSLTATSSPNTTDTLSSTTEPGGAPDIGAASADADAAWTAIFICLFFSFRLSPAVADDGPS